jgi:hypothetical protein
VAPAIHPLDCTKREVNPKNDRYEGAGVVKEGGRVLAGLQTGDVMGSGRGRGSHRRDPAGKRQRA